MYAKVFGLATVLAFLIMPAAGVAQQGHPLAGIWSGDWGPTPSDRTPVLIDLTWENTTLSGIIDPGFPDAAEIRMGTLNSKNWTVHLEAEGTGANGTPVPIIVDGQLDNLGSPNRTLTGTWARGNVLGDFKLTRE